MIETRRGDVDTLRDVVTAEHYLLDLAHKFDMTPISESMVENTRDSVAGILLLAESHASIHAVNYAAWIDLFTCREFSDNQSAAIRHQT